MEFQAPSLGLAQPWWLASCLYFPIKRNNELGPNLHFSLLISVTPYSNHRKLVFPQTSHSLSHIIMLSAWLSCRLLIFFPESCLKTPIDSLRPNSTGPFLGRSPAPQAYIGNSSVFCSRSRCCTPFFQHRWIISWSTLKSNKHVICTISNDQESSLERQ